jgi:hypothetical protein
LQARQGLQEQAEREEETMGKRGFDGKTFVDAALLRKILEMRRMGSSQEEIERRWGLKKGVLMRLGDKGLVDAV